MPYNLDEQRRALNSLIPRLLMEAASERAAEEQLAPTAGSRSANARFVDEKMKADPAYAPYCLQRGCLRMVRVSPTRAECSCGSYHQIPENS